MTAPPNNREFLGSLPRRGGCGSLERSNAPRGRPKAEPGPTRIDGRDLVGCSADSTRSHFSWLEYQASGSVHLTKTMLPRVARTVCSPVLYGEPVTHAPSVGVGCRMKIGDPVRTVTVPLDGRRDEPMRTVADCDLELVVGTESGWGRLCPGGSPAHRIGAPGLSCLSDAVRGCTRRSPVPLATLSGPRAKAGSPETTPRSSPALESFTGPYPDPLTARSTDHFTHHFVTQHGMPLLALLPGMRAR